MSAKSREEAELSFMEVAVDLEERQGLNQEIQETILRNKKAKEEEDDDALASGDEWVDHSDMEDNWDCDMWTKFVWKFYKSNVYAEIIWYYLSRSVW